MNLHLTVDELAGEVGELQPLPAVALRVLEISAGDQFSAQELALAISTDQALTAKVLRLANSAYFGFPRRISTVRDAVVLLGYRAVHSATLASCVIDAIPEGANLDYRQFWRFGVTVGALAEILARAAARHVDEAFTAGVLHNVGRLALDRHRPDALAEACSRARSNHITIAEAERSILGFDDAELGAALARRWNFPEQLVSAVEHHQQHPDQLAGVVGPAALVSRARDFVHAHGITDGVEPRRDCTVDPRWGRPPLSDVLRTEGGMEGVTERVAAFMENAIIRR